MHTDRPSDLAMDPDRRPRVLPPTAPPAGELVSRYSRQMLVPGLNGMPGQQSISSSSVLVVGAGGIGSTAIMYLAGAGVGRLGIADFDRVDLSNLHRQIIYRVDEVGLLKAECAKQRVSALNPTVDVIAITERVDCHNALEVIQDFDLVVDATDNFTVRYVLNDACVFLSKPLVSGAAGKKACIFVSAYVINFDRLQLVWRARRLCLCRALAV